MIKKRWQVSEDNVTWTREVHPLNAKKLTISESRDLDAGQVFFRKKIGQEIEFWDKTPGKDYTYFRSFERRRNGRCQTLYVRLQIKCNRQWSTYWTGQFSTGSGNWDLDKCIFAVKPETVDAYTCMLENMDEKVNVLNADVVTANVAALPPGMEITWGYSGGGLPASEGWEEVDTQTLVRPTIGAFPGGNETRDIYWRETITTVCVDGASITPSGDGWVQVGFSCVDGVTKWARPPLIPWPFPNDPLYVGPVVTGDLEPPASPACENWLLITSFNPPGTGAAGIYICLDLANSQYQINRARKLEHVFKFLLEQQGCELSGLRSDFFEIDPLGDAPGYVAGTNYVTGLENNLAHLLLFQKSDMIDPDSSNPATIGRMSIKELMTALQVMFQCLWDIENGWLRIEHWTYWEGVAGSDLSEYSNVIEPLAYQHSSSNVPRIERLTFMESRTVDFVGRDIVYNSQCARLTDPKEYSPGKITTDIAFILSDPSAINKDGFVMASSFFNGTDYDVDLSAGAITGTAITNGALSTANLMRDYWTWNRLLRNGNMNGQDVVFDGIVNNIRQEGVSVGMCCKLLRMDSSKTIGTTLGSRIGSIRASVEDVEHQLDTDRSIFNLSYPY
jgi:hypothetical protein